MKKLRVTIEGKVYEVLVETIDDHGKSTAVAPSQPVSAAPAAAPVSAAPVSAPVARPAAGGAGDVTSPLAGKIVSIDVKVGDTVAEGAQVATIEAMKMNTYIFAPKAGKVAEVLASAGEGVEEGTVLLRIA